MNMSDYSKLIDSPHQVYILGDLNSKQYSLGNRLSITVGDTISSLEFFYLKSFALELKTAIPRMMGVN